MMSETYVITTCVDSFDGASPMTDGKHLLIPVWCKRSIISAVLSYETGIRFVFHSCTAHVSVCEFVINRAGIVAPVDVLSGLTFLML
jgi:hypothetical protein